MDESIVNKCKGTVTAFLPLRYSLVIGNYIEGSLLTLEESVSYLYRASSQS